MAIYSFHLIGQLGVSAIKLNIISTMAKTRREIAKISRELNEAKVSAVEREKRKSGSPIGTPGLHQRKSLN